MKLTDLTGNIFGRLVVLHRAENKQDPRKPKGRTAWVCRCECGTEKIIASSALTSGGTVSCGCYNKEQITKAKLIDLTGRKFGKLVVCHRDTVRVDFVWWWCLCECGKSTCVKAGALTCGATRSCGCVRRKLPPQEAQRRVAYRGFLANAKIRNIEVSITELQWIALTSKPCAYCGEIGSNETKPKTGCYGTTFKHNGIDRKNSDLPYTIENCVPCCKWCNKSKGCLQAEQFITLASKIVRYQTQNA